MEEISDHAKNLTLSDDLEKPLEERVDLFYNFVKVSSFSVASAQRDLQHLEQVLLRHTELNTNVVTCSKGRRTEPSTASTRRSWPRRSVWTLRPWAPSS